jgi:uncharacterized protein (TIGR02996 family)
MTTAEAFLRTILEDPADDGVRLIYADWLEEHGQAERAEFIRLQVRRIEFGRQCSLVGIRLRDWFGSLLGSSWTGYLQWRAYPEPADLGFFGDSAFPVVEWQVRRGFVQAVSLSLDDFRRCAAHLFRSQPVTQVTLTDRLAQSVVADPSRSWFTFLGNRYLANFSYDLPCCLEPFLGEPHYSGLDLRKRWDYPNQEAAQAALSRACVAWGRHEAELPPLASAAYNPVVDGSLCSEE